MNHINAMRTGFLILISGLMIGGCVIGPLDGKDQFDKPSLSPARAAGLRRELDAFQEETEAGIEAAADRIVHNTVSNDTRRAALLLKTRFVDRLDDKLREPNAVVATVDALVICLQALQFIEGADGARLFGEDQAIAIEAVRRAAHRIEAILARYTPTGTLPKLRGEVRRYAAKHPFTGEFHEPEPASTRLDAGMFRGLQKLLSAPLAPFRAAEGVKEGADAFRDFNKTVGDLPREIRWEAELLLLSIERNEVARSALRSFDRTSRGIYSLARSVDSLPQTLQQSVDAAVGSALDNVNENKTVQAAIKDLDQITESVAVAAKAVEQLPKDIRQSIDHSVETACTAVDENESVRSALDGFQKISHSLETFSKVADRWPADVEQVVASSTPLVDYACWWAAKLLMLAAALAAGLIIFARLMRMPKPATRSNP